MSEGQRIAQELGLGGVISKTFELYRRDFSKYLTLFLVLQAIVGALTTLVRRAILLPKVPPPGATSAQLLSWIPEFFGALLALVTLTAIVAWVFYPVAIGGAVKLASDEIVTGRAELMASVRYAFSRIVWMWVVGIILGIIVSVGFIALIVPGIILALMFSLAIPAVIIERAGIESLGRSRQLVSQRWLKTFALFLVLGAAIGLATVIVDAVAGPFGVASTMVSSLLSAFYLPVIPIALTVYYYSNAARIAPPQAGQAPTASGAPPQAGMKFCPNCGTQMASTAAFCPGCGAKQAASY